jgi:hypothetical protein
MSCTKAVERDQTEMDTLDEVNFYPRDFTINLANSEKKRQTKKKIRQLNNQKKDATSERRNTIGVAV